MTLPFADSAQSTLGIEWELALVDAVSGELRSEAPDLLRALHVTEGLAEDDVNPHMTSELLQNTVELVTGVHERVDAATADLGRIAARGRRRGCAGHLPVLPGHAPVRGRDRAALDAQ
ncbi:glutamate-cysteine ligase family protein [Micrococcus luteus]|nr:glutamate-cysteine ligase family protein [Micrococcus luteus]